MAYVSCKYGPPPAGPNVQMVVCTDEANAEWWLSPGTLDTDPQFKAFTEDGGEIAPYEEPEEPPPPEPEPEEEPDAA